MDQSTNHVIMMLSCIHNSLALSGHFPGSGEMPIERGAIIDRNGNISIKLCGVLLAITRMARMVTVGYHTEEHNVPKGMTQLGLFKKIT